MGQRKPTGYTVIELAITVAVALVLIAVALPLIGTTMENHRLNGAVRRLMSDTRDARSRAVSFRWQYRIFGYGDTSGTRPNQYRIEGRTGTTAFPAPSTDGPFKTATQEAGLWVNLPGDYAAIRVNPGGAATFEVIFDEAGSVTSALSAITIQRGTGESRTLQPYRPGYVKCTNC
ncbi:MAG TPA: hypothetical protein VGT06_13325 [Candidatus Methylomirabilis sp.]|nr:hypothetical protein [Candidatus Methylomirabilis sp.]